MNCPCCSRKLWWSKVFLNWCCWTCLKSFRIKECENRYTNQRKYSSDQNSMG